VARPLRLEFPGAVYHLTARGDRQEPIFLNDADRRKFLELLAKEIKQQDWICYAYCLMDNHYHLLIETPQPNLVAGMRRLNGVYTQAFNYRRNKPGHVFQGRYKSILVDKDNYLLELCRYIVLNPVRAKAVKSPEQWSWSSYPATAGLVRAESWMATERVLALFSGSRKRYRSFVMEGIGKGSVWEDLRGQIYLGDESFLERMQDRVEDKSVRGIAKVQMRPMRPGVEEIKRAVADQYDMKPGEVFDRRQGEAYRAAVYLMRRAGNLPLWEVAERAGISAGRVSQIQTQIEADKVSAQISALLKKYKLKP
jgi:REP element-mobilizing transposase RayT